MKEYTVEVNGIEHTFLLDDAEAERRGLKAADSQTTKAPAPANKARTAKNKKA